MSNSFFISLLPNINILSGKIDDNKTVIDDIHDTDLPAAKTVIDDIHDTDLPAAKTVVDTIRSTDVPAIQTNIDTNETKIDTNKTLIEAIDMLPTENVVHSGTAEDDYSAPNTFEDVTANKIIDLLIQDNPAVISFKNDGAVWSDDKTLPIGMHSLDYKNFGVKIKNLNAASNSVYQITLYR